MINRTFCVRVKYTILQLHRSLVRPRFEYGVQAGRQAAF